MAHPPYLVSIPILQICVDNLTAIRQVWGGGWHAAIGKFDTRINSMIDLILKLTLMVKFILVFWKGIPVRSYEPFAYSVLHVCNSTVIDCTVVS